MVKVIKVENKKMNTHLIEKQLEEAYTSILSNRGTILNVHSFERKIDSDDGICYMIVVNFPYSLVINNDK